MAAVTMKTDGIESDLFDSWVGSGRAVCVYVCCACVS